METKISKLNNTLSQVIQLVNSTMNITNNKSEVPVKDLYEDYRIEETYNLAVYRTLAYILSVLIIISNLSVVVSSGLILRQGQKSKSTYILLGNVSLADTIVGVSMMCGLSIDYTLNNSAICVLQMGMLVCPAMVSIFSVGLIAIDRYIYILHGLYYDRWFNTTRVRIGILLIWLISITLAFLPATGWVNHELALTRCVYIALFPGPLILLNSILSIIPIIVVVVLYAFILVKALQTVKTINNTIKIKEVAVTKDEPKIRLNRRTINNKSPNIRPASYPENECNIQRSASFNCGRNFEPKLTYKCKSNENLSDDTRNKSYSNDFQRDSKPSEIQYESDLSVYTVESNSIVLSSTPSLSIDSANNQPNRLRKPVRHTKSRKIKEPNKWRAIKVVLLTSGSFILTWLPFFVTVIFFVFCEEKLTNPKCIRLRALLGGPLAILAFVNSILNPLIYAWWHKGFQRSAKAYYKQYLHKYVCFVIR